MDTRFFPPIFLLTVVNIGDGRESNSADEKIGGRLLIRRISIIVPSYNQAQFLPSTLDSIMNQSVAPYEVIVIDGGSTDGSVDILSRYAEKFPCIEWISEADNGPAYAVNKGLQRVTGDIIGIQSSDDIYMDGAFSDVIEAFKEQPDAGFLLGDVSGINTDGKVVYTRRFHGVSWPRLFAVSLCIPQSSIFFRRHLIEEVGYWNPEYYSCDLDYWMRLLLRTKAIYLPVVLSGWRRYPEQRTRPDRYVKIWNDYWRMIDDSQELHAMPRQIRRWARASRHFLVFRFPPRASLYLRWKHFLIGVVQHPSMVLYNPWRIFLSLLPFHKRLRMIISRIRYQRVEQK